MKNLSGKKLLIIGGAFQHCKIVEAAREMGVITYVVDYLPVEKSPTKQIADYHFEYNITEYDKIVEICRREHIDGVIASHLDACQIPYQTVCERLNLPCFGTKEQFHILTDKTAFIQKCIEYDVDVIPQYSENDFADSDQCEAEFPVFVKPCDSRGSRGQTICYQFDEVAEAIRFAKSESKSGKVIIEKYMGDKQEFTITYLFIDGKPYLLRTGDRFVGAKEEHMDKSAVLSISPSRNLSVFLDYEAGKITNMLQKIGIRNAPVFMQGFVDGEKVRFFDPGLRFPGCEYDRMYMKATGINTCSYLVYFALTGHFPEISSSIDPKAQLNGKVSIMLFVVLKPGKIGKIVGLDKIKQNSKVISFSQKYNVGDTVGEFYNVNQRFCEADLLCDSIEDAKNTINWIYDTLLILDEDNKDMKMSIFDTNLL